jgi:hypothetical protein
VSVMAPTCECELTAPAPDVQARAATLAAGQTVPWSACGPADSSTS